MEDRIARFVSGLRASGVRVSIAESQDAWRAIQLENNEIKAHVRKLIDDTIIMDLMIPTFMQYGIDL